jgi:SagB-type dehydrogenase family enzyme
MKALYDNTVLTPIRVAKTTGYLNWDTQPSQFKHYPKFLYRYYFSEVEALKVVELSRCVTDFKHISGNPYYRLNTASAGNLHPTELYVQIRGIKGVISGIYHIDPHDECLVLVSEIETDGIETALGLEHRLNGMIFILSLVPFRSEWKYHERALRYCYLDAGHQLGTLHASVELCGQKCTILSNIDRELLDKWMGFGGDEFSCMAVLVGQESEKKVHALKSPLIQVAPLDYTEGVQSVRATLSEISYNKSPLSIHFGSKLSISSLLMRRSARQFFPKPFSVSDTHFFMDRINETPGTLNPYVIVLKSEGLEQGLYLHGRCLAKGNFEKRVAQQMVDQHFLSNASMVVIYTAVTFSPEAMMQAGGIVQALYLYAQERNLGCTGVGAFYDRQLQKFLDTQDSIIYVCALGVVS